MAIFEGVAALRGRGFVGDRPGQNAVVDAAVGPEIDLDRIGGQLGENVGLRGFEPSPAGLRRLDRAQRAQLQEIPLARRQGRRGLRGGRRRRVRGEAVRSRLPSSPHHQAAFIVIRIVHAIPLRRARRLQFADPAGGCKPDTFTVRSR